MLVPVRTVPTRFREYSFGTVPVRIIFFPHNTQIGGWALVLRCVQFLYSAMRILLFLRAIFCSTVPFFNNCAQFLVSGTYKLIIARNSLTLFIGRIVQNFYLWKNLVEIQKIKKFQLIFSHMQINSFISYYT